MARSPACHEALINIPAKKKRNTSQQSLATGKKVAETCSCLIAINALLWCRSEWTDWSVQHLRRA